MATRASNSAALNLRFLLIALVAGQSFAQLTNSYYKGKCGKADVESLIYNAVEKKMTVGGNKGLVGDLVRLQFHDCFVRVTKLKLLLFYNYFAI